jgi:alkylation response protein AidB-like acyl-CoA dehydrogenase
VNFEFSNEQIQLQITVDSLMRSHYRGQDRVLYSREPVGWSRAMWERYAELGLLALPFRESDGGLGGGPIETMIVLESFGRCLVLEPFFASIILGGTILKLAGSDQQRGALVPLIVEGKALLAFAHSERQARYNLSDIATKAEREGSGWILNGTKSFVVHGDCADWLIVSARSAGARCDQEGITLFLLDAKLPGIDRRCYPTLDGRRGAEILISNVRVGQDALIGHIDHAFPVIRNVVEHGIAALASEAVGMMHVLLDTTVEYMKTRVQFGSPIGKFQALQHRAADMYVWTELARSMAQFAVAGLEEPDQNKRTKAIAATKVQIGRSARFVSQQAIQLHGGIAATEEYLVGAYFRRLMTLGIEFGDVEHHQRVLAKAGGLIDVADVCSPMPATR